MRIYHNIPALTAYNSLNSTNNAMEKSIQKLSTGLRINSAADDAAGFAISEKMRSQINGLEIAIRNTQDATSMLQTAEGALGETNSMLQRMRELAVQASNDTLTSQDRSYIQLEIDQLQDQIDRIAKTTQFNKKRLLDGSSAGITSSSNLSVKAFVRGSLREIDQFGQKKSFEGNYKIKITVDPSQTGQGQVQKSTIMTIKHPNVITDVEKNAEDGIVKVEVDNLPAANFNVSANTQAPTEATAEVSSHYGFTSLPEGSGVMSLFNVAYNQGAGISEDDYNALSTNADKAVYEQISGTTRYKMKAELTETEYTDTNLNADLKAKYDAKYTLAEEISEADYTAAAADTTFTGKYEAIDPSDASKGYKLKDPTANTLTVEEYNALTSNEAKGACTFTSALNDDTAYEGLYDINNASILFEITSVSDDSVTLKAQSNVLTLDGNVDSAVMEDIILKFDSNGTATTFDVSKLVGVKDEDANALVLSLSKNDMTQFKRGDKFVMNVSGYNYLDTENAGDLSVNVEATQDPDWQYNWADNKTGVSVFNDGNDDTISYTLTSSKCTDKEIHFRNYYLDSTRGTVYDGDVILTTDDKFVASGMNDSDNLAKFTAAYIGKTATGDTKLRARPV